MSTKVNKYFAKPIHLLLLLFIKPLAKVIIKKLLNLIPKKMLCYLVSIFIMKIFNNYFSLIYLKITTYS
jgi:hypothetical protein